MAILSRPSDDVRIMMLPWAASVLMYVFFFNFSTVSALNPVTAHVPGSDILGFKS